MKKILILGVGNAQIDLIEYCKNEGYEVHGCSYSHGDNGENLVDVFALINIIDTEQIKKYVKENNINIVYSVGSDLAMPSVAKVCDDLNLPCFISEKTAHLCNTKNELREFLTKSFKGNINYQVIGDEITEVNMEYPFILKPVDSQGQRGVFKVSDYNEYKDRLGTSLSFSKSKKVIAEEFIDGDEISVNTFSINGECIFKLISDRIVWENLPGGIIHKHLIPSKYDVDGTREKILDLVERTLHKLSINNGPAYFQIKIKNNYEPILIEVTPRLDGCHMWKLIKYYCGIDLLDLTVHHLNNELNEKVKIDIKPIRQKVVLEFMCQEPDSKVRKNNFDTSNAEYVKWYYNDDDIVKKMNGYMEKCGYKIYEVK